MARPRTPIGTFGEISFARVGSKVRARTRYRDDDGWIRRVQAAGASEADAVRRLKATLAHRESRRTYGELSPDSSFGALVKIWLEDLDLDRDLARSTRDLCERDMRTIVLPAFEHLRLRGITVNLVDRFLRHLAANRSYAMAKHARTVLSLALGLAVRYDALARNPVREARRLRKTPTKVRVLSVAGHRRRARGGPRLEARRRAAGPETGRAAGADSST
jgi:hypothetical protein